MSGAAERIQPDPYDLLRQGISQAVAEAMIPVREEINANFRALGERVDKLESRVGKIEERMDKLEGRFDRLEERMGRMESDIAFIKDKVAAL